MSLVLSFGPVTIGGTRRVRPLGHDEGEHGDAGAYDRPSATDRVDAVARVLLAHAEGAAARWYVW